jgi:hypothetical protein
MSAKSQSKQVARTADKSRPALQPSNPVGTGGSRSQDWNMVLATQIVDALWAKNSDAKTYDQQLCAAIAGLAGIAPKDEIEGMIAAQMLAAHNAAMECYRRAMISEQTFEGRRENLNQANKLSRTYSALLEALNSHRGKGTQKIVVERVNVHTGGQAIVGTVENRGAGVGTKMEERPHAIAYAPEQAMWSEDTFREPLPIASDGKRTMQIARRNVPGTAKG